MSIVLKIKGASENAVIVFGGAEACGKDGGIGVVELNMHKPAKIIGGHRPVQVAVAVTQLFEETERFSGEPPQLWVVALGLQLTHHDQRKHNLVLIELLGGVGIGQQDRGIKHVGTHALRLKVRGRNYVVVR